MISFASQTFEVPCKMICTKNPLITVTAEHRSTYGFKPADENFSCKRNSTSPAVTFSVPWLPAKSRSLASAPSPKTHRCSIIENLDHSVSPAANPYLGSNQVPLPRSFHI